MEETSSAESRGVASTTTVTVVGVALVVVGVGLGFLVALGSRRYHDLPETLLVAVGWAALFRAPGVLAALGVRGRPALLLPAAVVLVPLSLLSFAGVLLPLLIPAAILFVAYARRAASAPRPRVPAAVTTVVVVALLLAAVVALFAHEDPRTYRTADGVRQHVRRGHRRGGTAHGRPRRDGRRTGMVGVGTSPP